MNAEFKIVSGGQTGGDRAALDWMIQNGVNYAGWCPKAVKLRVGRLMPATNWKKHPELL
jgi:hypothetical protein